MFGLTYYYCFFYPFYFPVVRFAFSLNNLEYLPKALIVILQEKVLINVLFLKPSSTLSYIHLNQHSFAYIIPFKWVCRQFSVSVNKLIISAA